MKITQGKRPRIKPYSFFITGYIHNELVEIYSWIFTELGPYDNMRMECRLSGGWVGSGKTTVYFKYTADAMAFKLRWM